MDDKGPPGAYIETAVVQPVRIGEALRRNVMLIVALASVGLSLGVVAGQRDKQTHSATTSILLNPLEGNPFYPSSRGEQLINVSTEAQALRSNSIAAQVAEAVGSDVSESSLLADVRVAVPANTQILEVTFSARSDEVALTNSQAFADAYLDARRQRATDLISEQTERLDQQIGNRQEELQLLADELTDSSTTPARTDIVERLMDALATEVSTLSTTQAQIAAQPLDPGQVVTSADIDDPGPFGALLWPVVGALVGGFGGLALALLRLRADTRMRGPDAARETGLSVVGVVVGADIDDEYRRIRVAILALEQRRPFALLVSGASEAARGPACVVDLATSIARSGLDTVVIDATMHGDGPTSLTAGSNAGVADVLLGDASLADAVETVGPRLSAMPPGEQIHRVTDLLTGDTMARLLTSVKSQCDVLLLAGDSLQHGSAQSLASMVDAVVVETHQDVTTRPELERVMHMMDLLPSNLLGTIFVGEDARQRTKTFQRPTALVRSQPSDGSQSELDARDVDASTPQEQAGSVGMTRRPQSRSASGRHESTNGPGAGRRGRFGVARLLNAAKGSVARSDGEKPRQDAAAPDNEATSQAATVENGNDGRPTDGEPADERPLDGRGARQVRR